MNDNVDGPISQLRFLPGTAKLLSMHPGKNLGTTALWDSDTGQLLRRFDQVGAGKSIAFDPVHGRIAVAGQGKVVSLRDFETGEEIKLVARYENDLQSISFSPDGNWLAYGDGWDPLPDGTPPGKLRLCNLQTGEITVLEGHDKFGIYDLAFSPDGETLASVGGDGILWDVSTGNQRARLHGHQSAVFAVDFTPDGKTLATGGMDNTVRLWDPVTGELRLVLQGHPYWVTSVEFNHDSTYLVSSSFDGELRFWNAPIPANASDN
jgi:WD40 repeat protein